MDEWTAETFLANREEPIPAINTPGNSGKSSDSKHDPAKGKAPDGATEGEDVAGEATAGARHSKSHSLQDRLFAKFVPPCSIQK